MLFEKKQVIRAKHSFLHHLFFPLSHEVRKTNIKASCDAKLRKRNVSLRFYQSLYKAVTIETFAY